MCSLVGFGKKYLKKAYFTLDTEYMSNKRIQKYSNVQEISHR